jgi:hypothetical protein
VLLAVALGACARTPSPTLNTSGLRADTIPAARSEAAYPGSAKELARALLGEAERYRVSGLTRRTLRHRRLWDTLGPIADSTAGMHREEIGRSVERRPLYAIYFGRGPVRVMLWSQMHGDEPTATLALADLVYFISKSPNAPLVREIADRLTVIAIPMLNPDGAERGRRGNAAGIDINRDARNQASPEARALAAVHARWSPRFGFNLHDQSRRVDGGNRVIAISLLAPPPDRQGSDNETRIRAKQVAAIMRTAADSLVEGRVSRYDEAFNQHAFGDAMQSWGTSTVLLETGSWRNDTEKEYLRRVNFALLLAALNAIATGSYARADLKDYESLAESREVAARE